MKLKTPEIQSNPIKQWAEDDRPREKLLIKGQNSLSDSELMAILIGSGTRNKSAVDLSKEILNVVENNLLELSKLGVSDLLKFEGIGVAKAVSIIAALELGNRKRSSDSLNKASFLGSNNVSNYFAAFLSEKKHEEFHVVLLNKANKVIKHLVVSKGGVDGTVVDVKSILKEAVSVLASSVILCHNHPSGNINPSIQDKQITNKIIKAASYFDISVLDHVIIADNSYFSFADEGLI